MMTTPKLIACELHDYLEIACLYGYELRLHLSNQECLEGRAVDLLTQDRREFLVIESDRRHTVALDELVKLQTLTPNAKFAELVF